MARTLKATDNGGDNPEQPFVKRLIELEREKEAIGEDIKQVYIEVKEADLRVMPIRLAVKLYLESEEHRLTRENNEAEAERIVRALGGYADTPLGEAAVNEAAKPKNKRQTKLDVALAKAREHLGSQSDIEDFTAGAVEAPFEEDPVVA